MGGNSTPENFLDYKEFYSSLRVIFLERLNSQFDSINTTIMARIDQDLNITMTLDPEVKGTWFPLGIRKNYTEVMDVAHTFISSMGRMKYLQPIYQALIDTNQKDIAIQWYQENINFYHPYCIAKIAKMLGMTSEEVRALKTAQKLKSTEQEEILFLTA